MFTQRCSSPKNDSLVILNLNEFLSSAEIRYFKNVGNGKHQRYPLSCIGFVSKSMVTILVYSIYNNLQYIQCKHFFMLPGCLKEKCENAFHTKTHLETNGS